jgi:hypothetical protein
MPSYDGRKETGADWSRALAWTAEPPRGKLAIEDVGMSSRPPPPTWPWVTDKAPESGAHFSFRSRTKEPSTGREEYLGLEWARSREFYICRTQKSSARMGPDDNK